jgi:hypothetical protein
MSRQIVRVLLVLALVSLLLGSLLIPAHAERLIPGSVITIPYTHFSFFYDVEWSENGTEIYAVGETYPFFIEPRPVLLTANLQTGAYTLRYLGNRWGRAKQISGNVIVGEMADANGFLRAYVWNVRDVSELKMLPLPKYSRVLDAYPLGINTRGQVVGDNSACQPWMFDPRTGQSILLPFLPDAACTPNRIADSGLIVGDYFRASETLPVCWEAGRLTLLQSPIQSVWNTATAVSENGRWIAGRVEHQMAYWTKTWMKAGSMFTVTALPEQGVLHNVSENLFVGQQENRGAVFYIPGWDAPVTPGTIFGLEANLDFMWGVHVQKGRFAAMGAGRDGWQILTGRIALAEDLVPNP